MLQETKNKTKRCVFVLCWNVCVCVRTSTRADDRFEIIPKRSHSEVRATELPTHQQTALPHPRRNPRKGGGQYVGSRFSCSGCQRGKISTTCLLVPRTWIACFARLRRSVCTIHGTATRGQTCCFFFSEAFRSFVPYWCRKSPWQYSLVCNFGYRGQIYLIFFRSFQKIKTVCDGKIPRACWAWEYWWLKPDEDIPTPPKLQ